MNNETTNKLNDIFWKLVNITEEMDDCPLYETLTTEYVSNENGKLCDALSEIKEQLGCILCDKIYSEVE